MTHNQLLSDSTLIEKTAYPNSHFGIPTKKKRWRMIAILIFTSLFSIFVKFIYLNPGQNFFTHLVDYSNPVHMLSSIVFLASIVYIVFAFIVKIMASCQAYLNHMTLYTWLRFIKSLSSAIVFASAANTFLLYFSNTFEITSDWFQRYVLGVFQNVLLVKGYLDVDITLKVVSFVISLISFIPSFLFLLIKHIVIIFKLLPPLCIYFYFNWLIFCPKTFEHYTPYDGNSELTIVERRRINHPYKNTAIDIILKLVLTIAIGFVIFGVIYPIYLNLSFSKQA